MPDNAAVQEERVSVASQRQLIWWRFRKHKLAMVGAVIVALFYLVALFGDFLSTSDPQASEGQRSLMPPQAVRLIQDGSFSPHVYKVVGQRDPVTLQRSYAVDPAQRIPVRLFAHGYRYKLLGLIPTDLHLIGTEGTPAEQSLFLLGTDQQGRDIYSRLVQATRTSMLIGLTGVTLSILFGVVLGGISGYYGGAVDTVIQRVIEITRSIPVIPGEWIFGRGVCHSRIAIPGECQTGI